MLSRILYCTAVVLATAAVILIALFSPLPHRSPRPRLALSFYIQQPHVGGGGGPAHPVAPAALIYLRTLTEGPENASRMIGKAQGFIIPAESFAHSAFNIIYLTFDTHEYSGSISVEAKNLVKEKGELSVVGGTGSFAFARGVAVFAKMSNFEASYHIKLDLEFPSTLSPSVPG